MTKLSLSSSPRSPLRTATRWLAPPALALALVGCATSVSGGPEGDDDDGADPAPDAACLPAGAACGSGGRVAASVSDGFSAVIDLDVDPRDGATLVLSTHEAADEAHPRAGLSLSRGAIGADPAWRIDLGALGGAIGVDPTDGSIAFAGRFEGELDALGVTTSAEALAAEAGLPPRTPGLLVGRIAADGRVLAARALSRDVTVIDVVARAGRVVLSGFAHGVTASTTVDDAADAYVAVLDGDLAMELEEAVGGPGDDRASTAAIRADGAIVIGGAFEERIALGQIAASDDRRGAAAFAALLGADLSPRAITLVDDDGLRTRGYEAMGARPVEAADGTVVVQVSYDGGDPELETGLDRWAHAIAVLDADLAKTRSIVVRVAADATFGVLPRAGGGYAIGGTVRGPLALGGAELEPRGELDGFAMVLDEDGAPVWATRFGDEESQQMMALAPTDDGIVLGGMFRGSIALGEGVVEASEHGSAFVLGLPLP